LIVGIGVDIVDVARFEQRLSTTPRLLDRLFAESEQIRGDEPMPLRSLAGRFAAKEALVKALGDSAGVPWHWSDLRVISDDLGNPGFELVGTTKQIADAQGIRAIHLSMSHDGGFAIAYVVTES
jgi:holo-[acyl-carrier protein] synthase